MLKIGKRTAIFLVLGALLMGCSRSQGGLTQELPEDPGGFFPQFSIPEGAYVPGGGGGGGTDQAGMEFDLVTNMPIEEVHRYYADQLEQIGWVELTRHDSEETIKTYWELTQGEQTWAAYLQVDGKKINNENGYRVALRAVLPP